MAHCSASLAIYKIYTQRRHLLAWLLFVVVCCCWWWLSKNLAEFPCGCNYVERSTNFKYSRRKPEVLSKSSETPPLAMAPIRIAAKKEPRRSWLASCFSKVEKASMVISPKSCPALETVGSLMKRVIASENKHLLSISKSSKDERASPNRPKARNGC